MFWQDDDKPRNFEVPDDIVDLIFDIRCRELPVDHQCGLANALRAHLPDLADDDRIGVHSIHTAGSQNGWERPDPGLGQRLVPSRRTKLTIRAPKERLDEIRVALDGADLEIDGCRLTIGEAKEKRLSTQGTVFSRYIVLEPGEESDENAFMHRVVGQLAERGIRVRKALCGKTTAIAGNDGPVKTRSLMIADLDPDESIQLQQRGIGPMRHMGCGIFIPHKGIDPVKKTEDD
jgi:CRISPR-associated protein Cas6